MSGIGEYPERTHYCEFCHVSYTDADGGCECEFCEECGGSLGEDDLEDGLCEACTQEKYEYEHTCGTCCELSDDLVQTSETNGGDPWMECPACRAKGGQ